MIKKKSRSDYKYKGYTSPNKGTLQQVNSQHQHRWRETKKKKKLQISQKKIRLFIRSIPSKDNA